MNRRDALRALGMVGGTVGAMLTGCAADG